MDNKLNPLSIKSIEIRKLFGFYDYKIPQNINDNLDLSQLLIIYGDNGSGKTTILKMLFWLLSTRNKSGYKSKLAQTKFEKFSITFHNGIEIGAMRKKDTYVGGFNYYVKKNNRNTISIDLEAEPDHTIDLDDNSEAGKNYLKLLSFIRNLKISVFYLSDDRKILNSINSSDNESYRNNRFLNESDQTDLLYSKYYEEIRFKKLLIEKKATLEPSVDKLFEWVRTKVISGSKTGEKNSQVIFTDLIKNVFTPNKAIQQIESKKELIKEIENVESKVGPYVKFGLIEKFDSKTIKETITLSKDDNQLKQLQTILAPYIESINAKLQALEKVKDTLDLFLSSINNYFSNKTISFHLNTGFQLKQNGEEIEFSYLSSGEKQLLLLFINTITSAEVATIFIIDEPEISLNIKWQRNLIDTLLRFSHEKNIQYILSTHSLELLSSNIDNVTKLENLHGNKKEA